MPDAPGAKTPPDDAHDEQTPKTPRPWLILLIAAAFTAAIYFSSTRDGAPANAAEIDYTSFYTHAEQGRVERVDVQGRSIVGTFAEEQTIGERKLKNFRTQLPPQDDPELWPMLRREGVAVHVRSDEGAGLWEGMIALIPWLLIIGVGWFMMRRATLPPGAGSFGNVLKTPAKRFRAQDKVPVTFDDVAGATSAKRDLLEVVDFLREPERFARLGGKMPKGILLAGAPGTGKTLLARAVAGEAQVPFFSINASEFIELFVGVGASRVRALFEAAKKEAPAIVFIDEIDAVGRSRGTGLGGGHDEREQTLNQLLAELDGFTGREQVVVIAATNRPDVLDPALLRPGRFDRRVIVELPECGARHAILKVHARGKPIADRVSLLDIAKATPGYSGADLANLINEAAIHAIRRGGDEIDTEDFAAAQDKIQLGDPRDTMMSPAEKERVAVHESGHALMAYLMDTGTPLRRVSIIPRGMALGATQQATLGDKHLHTRSELIAKLRVLLGGYAAEQCVLGEVSTGAENDLEKASDLASRMVARMGMSDKLGPIHLEHRSQHPFLGARIATDAGVSDASIHEIELESRRLLLDALEDARETIQAHRPEMTRLIDALLEHETLDADALERLLSSTTSVPSGERVAAHA